jgi:nitrite reductase/ring-hydroxylating ferredoxin subunit
MAEAAIIVDGRRMIAVADIADLSEGVLKLVRADDARIALVRQGQAVHAVAAICTHARICLAPGRLTAEGLIECPMHGARFSPEDGSVRRAPATVPLATYTTSVRDGRVYVDPIGKSSSEPAANPSPWANWG